MKTPLIGQYEAMHDKGHFAGLSSLPYAGRIKELIDEYGARTILDYGCGKGHQYSRHDMSAGWGVTVSLYDPAVPGFTGKPRKADGVVCIDVMEHIEKKDVPAVLHKIFGLAGKFAFFVICTRPSKKMLPDGRNCHLTIEPPSWWGGVITEAMDRSKSDAQMIAIYREGL